MTKIIYIQASPRGSRSHSEALANTFVEAYSGQHVATDVVTINLFDTDLPELDNETLKGKYNIMHGREFTEEERQKWFAVEGIIEAIKSADILVFAVPMWNFSIPYKLKHFLDIIAQPTYTFEVGPDGYKGLLKAKAFIAYSRGGDIPDDAGYNFQASYMTHILGFMGITDVETVSVHPTLAAGPEGRDAAKEAARQKAEAIAETF